MSVAILLREGNLFWTISIVRRKSSIKLGCSSTKTKTPTHDNLRPSGYGIKKIWEIIFLFYSLREWCHGRASDTSKNTAPTADIRVRIFNLLFFLTCFTRIEIMISCCQLTCIKSMKVIRRWNWFLLSFSSIYLVKFLLVSYSVLLF